jgi:hypothetical protein
VTTASSEQTRTIPEFLADAPDVDQTELWATFWDILTGIKDRLIAELGPVERHPTSQGLDAWEAPDGAYEGSLNTYTGPSLEWFVHSWIGNRKASILDMNINVWLGPHVDVPHLCIVFGTIPRIFHYSDLIARRDLMTDLDYVRRYYEAENPHYLRFRGDDRFTSSVSHGTYMRAIASPVAHSYTAERSDEVVEALRGYVTERFERWLGWVKQAPEVPLEDRAALRQRDHFLREHIYKLDPMNALSERFLGPDLTRRLIDVRYGAEQLADAAGGRA